METPAPRFAPLAFDQRVAAEAVSALRRSITLISERTDQRVRQARTAQLHWRGAHRDRFDSALQEAIHEARSLCERMESLIARINAASENALLETKRRQRIVNEWQAMQHS